MKLYQDVASAVRDVVDELNQHTRIPYLRSEFAAIWRKLDQDHPHRTALEPLLAGNVTMDEVFKRLCIPVLLSPRLRWPDASCVRQYEIGAASAGACERLSWLSITSLPRTVQTRSSSASDLGATFSFIGSHHHSRER